MNRNWDIMRNSANGADPYGATRRMEQNRMRDRERWTSRDRDEGLGGGMPMRHYGQGHVPSYGEEGFGRASQGFGAYGNQGYGESYGQSYGQSFGGEYQRRGTAQYGGYGYEHGESETLGDGGGYDRDRFRNESGLLGRMEQGIDRAFGREWDRDRDERGRGMGVRGDDHPSLWDRVKGAFTGKGPKNWTRSDERIREDVCECLTYHPHIDASEIDVVVKDGEVTLTGTVTERRTKRLAEDIVEDVRGVRDVHNQIRVLRQMAQTTPQTGVTGTSSTGTSTNQTWNQVRR
jgi:hypothetical protein